jgi:glycine cleavage system transcriptional repressor
MKQYFVISAIGKNRPGIVAAVSELIYTCGCNLEDSRMTILGDQFALLILLSGDSGEVHDDLSRRCAELQKEKKLTVFLSPVHRKGSQTLESPSANYVMHVVGLDRAGIVYRTSKLLASMDIDVVDLTTRIDPAPESGSPMFTMTTRMNVPKGVDEKVFRSKIEALENDLHVEISLQRI